MVTGLVDTSIIIDILRQYPPAHTWLTKQNSLGVTATAYLEVLEGAPNKAALQEAMLLLGRFVLIDTLPSDRLLAIDFMRQYHLTHGMDT